MSDPLAEPLRSRIGGATAKALAAGLDLHTVGDLLGHFPRRYAERGVLSDLATLQPGEQVTVMAEIKEVRSRPMRQRRGTLLEVVVTDGRGTLSLTFFNQKWREKDLRVGRRGFFAGAVRDYRGTRQLTHPDYQLLADPADPVSPSVDTDLAALDAFAGSLIPVYPATANVTSWTIARALRVVLDTLPELPDPIPDEIRARDGLVGLGDGYLALHRPGDRADVERALERFRYEEAFVLQVVLARRRRAVAALAAVPRMARADGLLAAFDRRLPFALTAGQQSVAAAIEADLAREHPMHRLLQGEVGSGKTVVALRAMLAVVDAGGQAALLAPTEVLAQQHARSIRAMLGPLAEHGMLGGADQGTTVALLTGSQSAASRRQALLDVASGTAGIVVGTHALLQEHVDFFDLGLVVVDEQHRFGVEQRDALRAKGRTPPHVLVMTATPIPRTVAMTAFGDLEVSTLSELPAGRAAITTHVVPAAERPHYLERTWERVREEVQAGHQVYVVCPRIGGDEAAGEETEEGPSAAGGDEDELVERRPAPAVLELAPRLRDGPLAGLRLEVLHGRLPSDVKDDVMRRFAAGDVDVLVATTVIEVGVDVARATVMVVMDADRFGVSQLHQLRGRVGRGEAAGLCLLVTEAPAPSAARDRLDAVAATLDGFQLSRLDLEQRREGDVLGSAQSGVRSSLRVLRVLRDEDVIARAREDATAVVAADPNLERSPGLHRAVWIELGGERADYLEKA